MICVIAVFPLLLQIIGTDYLPALRKYIPDENIPRDYGGSSPYDLGDAPEERGIDDLATSLNAGNAINLCTCLDARCLIHL